MLGKFVAPLPVLFLVTCLPSPLGFSGNTTMPTSADEGPRCSGSVYYDDVHGNTVEVWYVCGVDVTVYHDGDMVLWANYEEVCSYECPDDEGEQCLSPPLYWWWGEDGYFICRGSRDGYPRLLFDHLEGDWEKIGDEPFDYCNR